MDTDTHYIEYNSVLMSYPVECVSQFLKLLYSVSVLTILGTQLVLDLVFPSQCEV